MKRDFTGCWIFDPQHSSLEIRRPDTVRLAIEHVEPRFRLERTLAFGGESDTFSIVLFTDGRETTCEHRGAHIRARARWEGDGLKFTSTVLKDNEEGSNEVVYRLVDGDILVAEEQFRSPSVRYDNVWRFARA